MTIDLFEIQSMINQYEAQIAPFREAEEEATRLHQAINTALQCGRLGLANELRESWQIATAVRDRLETFFAGELDELERLNRQFVRLAA